MVYADGDCAHHIRCGTPSELKLTHVNCFSLAIKAVIAIVVLASIVTGCGVGGVRSETGDSLVLDSPQIDETYQSATTTPVTAMAETPAPVNSATSSPLALIEALPSTEGPRPIVGQDHTGRLAIEEHCAKLIDSTGEEFTLLWYEDRATYDPDQDEIRFDDLAQARRWRLSDGHYLELGANGPMENGHSLMITNGASPENCPRRSLIVLTIYSATPVLSNN